MNLVWCAGQKFSFYVTPDQGFLTSHHLQNNVVSELYMLTLGPGRNAILLLCTSARHANISSFHLTKNTFVSLVLLYSGFWRGDGIDSLPNIPPS